MVASPWGSVNTTIKGISEPTTQTSCWRMPKRREGPSLGGQGDEALGHGVEGRLGHRAAQPDHEGQHDLREQGAPHGHAGRGRGDEPQGGQQQLLFAQALAQPPHENEPDDRPGTAARQDEAVPVQADAVHAPQPEGQHEDHEALQPAHDAHGGQPEHDLGMRYRLQPQEIALAILRLPGLAVLADLGGLVGPHALSLVA